MTRMTALLTLLLIVAPLGFSTKKNISSLQEVVLSSNLAHTCSNTPASTLLSNLNILNPSCNPSKSKLNPKICLCYTEPSHMTQHNFCSPCMSFIQTMCSQPEFEKKSCSYITNPIEIPLEFHILTEGSTQG